MKANAPEKLYLSKTIYSTYLYQVPDPDDETAVEYIRADAFVEKAENFLEMLLPSLTITHTNYDSEQMIIDFKKYMEE